MKAPLSSFSAAAYAGALLLSALGCSEGATREDENSLSGGRRSASSGQGGAAGDGGTALGGSGTNGQAGASGGATGTAGQSATPAGGHAGLPAASAGTSAAGRDTTGGRAPIAAGASNGGASATAGASNAGASGDTARGGASTGGAGGAAGGPPACATNQLASCTTGDSIDCHFGGAPGDYLVTLELGGDTAGDSYVEAETFRRLLGQSTTGAGETQRFSFFVNVRQPEGQPIQAVPAGTPGLDVYVRGPAPQLSAICFEARPSAPKVWIAGDSTVCDQDTTDYGGWGQQLPQFFLPPVSVANYADSGESSGSFLGSAKLWGAIKAGWKAGDFVLIQLGHNDKDVTALTFSSNLTALVTQAKSAGVNPILLTPTSRVGYALEEEHVNSTGANLPQLVRDLGASESVPVIDLTVTTWNWLQTIDYKAYFALGTDHTHTNPKGAAVIAGFVRDAIREQKLPLEAYLR